MALRGLKLALATPEVRRVYLQLAGVLVQNKPSAIIAMIPSLPAGTYTVKVITQYSGGSLPQAERQHKFHSAIRSPLQSGYPS